MVLGYQYDPDTEDGFSGQNYFPDEMQRQSFLSNRLNAVLNVSYKNACNTGKS